MADTVGCRAAAGGPARRPPGGRPGRLAPSSGGTGSRRTCCSCPRWRASRWCCCGRWPRWCCTRSRTTACRRSPGPRRPSGSGSATSPHVRRPGVLAVAADHGHLRRRRGAAHPGHRHPGRPAAEPARARRCRRSYPVPRCWPGPLPRSRPSVLFYWLFNPDGGLVDWALSKMPHWLVGSTNWAGYNWTTTGALPAYTVLDRARGLDVVPVHRGHRAGRAEDGARPSCTRPRGSTARARGGCSGGSPTRC